MKQPGLALGRTAFGADPQAYHAARRDYPAELFELVRARCASGAATRAFEIGPGTGKATVSMLRLGLASLTAIEPDARLAAYLEAEIGDPRLTLEITPFEEAELPAGSFDLGYAATSFHWLDMPTALAKVVRLLRPGGSWAMWWNAYQDPSREDPFRDTVTPLIQQLRAEAPSFRHEPRAALPQGLVRALDTGARVDDLREAGFTGIEHETMHWEARFDTEGVRALYASFSVMSEVPPERAEAFLDQVAEIAETRFGGQLTRPCVTVLYTARK
jgi:SAM-dependent methyltransferase